MIVRILDKVFEGLTKFMGDWPALAVMACAPAVPVAWVGWHYLGPWAGVGMFILTACVDVATLLVLALNEMDD